MTLDTNILIGYLNGDVAVVRELTRWKVEGRDLAISTISVAETLALPNLTPDGLNVVLQFLKTFVSIPFDDELAQTAALIRRVYRLTLPDAAIAATALRVDGALVTRDHVFRRLKEITVIEI